MSPSKACEALIKSREGLRLHAYLPTPNDVPTIGYGSTGKDIHLGLSWTMEQADARFTHDLARFAQSVWAAIAAAPTTQGQFDAMVSLAYNIGMGNFSKSTLLKRHKAGLYGAAADQFMVWDKQNGKVLNGLVSRRAAERALYKS